MEEQEEFFSQNHNRLLNFATWAKYLAWVVLVAYILWAGSAIIEYRNWQSIICEVPRIPGPDIIFSIPFFKLGINMVAIVLKGIVYFLILKGISLALNMVVETDINYREQKNQGGVS